MTRRLLARLANVLVFTFVTRDELTRAGRWVYRTAPVKALTLAEARGYRKGYHAACDDLTLATAIREDFSRYHYPDEGDAK